MHIFVIPPSPPDTIFLKFIYLFIFEKSFRLQFLNIVQYCINITRLHAISNSIDQFLSVRVFILRYSDVSAICDISPNLRETRAEVLFSFLEIGIWIIKQKYARKQHQRHFDGGNELKNKFPFYCSFLNFWTSYNFNFYSTEQETMYLQMRFI